ncbi:MAG: 30S ribosomal protein S16 [Desulfovibrio sp.]|jgi:small subunit ribosomal protein S16|nr:30S ribosomal protein S16 [Desulfovibrio sp.]
MAVKLKLTRLGSKKHPFYRVVAANDETRRDGRPLEFLGHYNPMLAPAEVKLDMDKINAWLARGAEPTDTVRSLIKNHTSPK